MKFKKYDKIICIEEFDEHNPKGYGVNLGKIFEVKSTKALTNYAGKKYQMVCLNLKLHIWVHSLHFRKATKLDEAMK